MNTTIKDFILNNYEWDKDESPEDAPENKKENYFSICHYILKTAKEERCKKDEALTSSRFFQWVSGLPSIFDILYTFENAADVLIEQDIKIDKTIYVMGEITAIYKELLKAEEYYQFFKTL
ncbi:MAG: hypothetical protein ACLR3W_14690 [Faecalibacillus intestinalis]|uniref:hypothetical protein n=1 Tax=Faecalibacillus intestinalis TaxID=1982626 RepID=UPI003991F1ED